MRQLKPLSEATLREIAEAIADSTDASAPSPPSFSPNQWDHPRPGPTIEPVNILANANPRTGLGLLAVFMAVGPTQEFRNKAYIALVAGGGGLDTINANAQADPMWNGAVAQVLAGKAPDTAELQAAKAVADSL